MAVADALTLHRQQLGGQAVIERGLAHGLAHLRQRQVGPQHRGASGHGGHDHRAVRPPRPARVVPGQGGAHLARAGVGRQAGRAVSGFGHLQHHGGQLTAIGQPLHHLALQLLVFGRIVLLTQQQRIGRQQAGQPGLLRGIQWRQGAGAQQQGQ